jgi:ribonuclease BN (tRNA processing enzyme)
LKLIFFNLVATVLLLPTFVSANCIDHSVALQILGSGGPEIDDQRASSSYLVWADKKAVALIDMGGGASLNYELSGAHFNDLDVVAFSHFHVDHSADFPVLVKGSYFSTRHRPLAIFGPDGNQLMPSTDSFIKHMFATGGSFGYLNNFVEPDADSYKLDAHTVTMKEDVIQLFQITSSLSLSAIPVHHGPIPSLAWRVDIYNCSITFSGDMNNDFHSLAKLAANTDILVAHNAVPEQATGAARNLHMPPSEIGLIANKAAVKKLVISHRMKRTLGREKETEHYIRKAYSGEIIFANDLDLITP